VITLTVKANIKAAAKFPKMLKVLRLIRMHHN